MELFYLTPNQGSSKNKSGLNKPKSQTGKFVPVEKTIRDALGGQVFYRISAEGPPVPVVITGEVIERTESIDRFKEAERIGNSTHDLIGKVAKKKGYCEAIELAITRLDLGTETTGIIDFDGDKNSWNAIVGGENSLNQNVISMAKFADLPNYSETDQKFVTGVCHKAKSIFKLQAAHLLKSPRDPGPLPTAKALCLKESLPYDLFKMFTASNLTLKDSLAAQLFQNGLCMTVNEFITADHTLFGSYLGNSSELLQ